MKCEIKDKDKAKALFISEINGAINIPLSQIPDEMSILDYVEFIEKNGIILTKEPINTFEHTDTI
jgi:hypothetical protein